MGIDRHHDDSTKFRYMGQVGAAERQVSGFLDDGSSIGACDWLVVYRLDDGIGAWMNKQLEVCDFIGGSMTL